MKAAGTVRTFLWLYFAAAVAVWSTRMCAASQRDAETGGQPVRIGIVAFDEYGADHESLQQALSTAEGASTAPLRFQIARGTYGDVAHWMSQGYIDLAVVTPGLFPLGDSPPPVELHRDRVRYLATVTVGPAITRWASEVRKEVRRHDRMGALTLVRRDSALRSAADLERAAREARLRILLVHPLSVSGGIAPLYALAQRGVDLTTVSIEYTHSHSASVRALLDVSDDGTGLRKASTEVVAFVWDDALRSNLDPAAALRTIPFPELDRLVIPSDAIVARGDFARVDEIRDLLRARGDASESAIISEPGDWRELHADVASWRFAAGPLDDRRDRTTFDEIGRLLVHFARTQPLPPRLALVLSGGGAKCSYQVGAVSAIEEKLAELRAANPMLDLDIHLVVGTSGGAINALPIALGVTASAEGREQFRDVWTSLDQRDIVRPSQLARLNVGLWFMLLQSAIVLVAVRRLVRIESQRAWWFGAILAVLGAVQLTLAYVDFKPWRMLGTNHAAHHLWLWLAFGARGSAWSLLILGSAVLVAGALRHRRNRPLTVPGPSVKSVLWLGLIGLPLVHVVTVLFFQQTLSGGEGMERALAKHYPVLINAEMSRRGLPPLDLSAAKNDAERLRTIGSQLAGHKLPMRDLVITGSRLQSAREAIRALPSDLYFYLPRRRAEPPGRAAIKPFGARGISLRDRPDLTLDVVLGSGSIFPVFPSRALPDFPAAGAEVELVDGGFAHNSPIEAAVLWDATHIVLIEASPPARLERTNFATNAMASFDHLYEQSQLLDARARGKVAIFTLAPDPPHLCVLDFADNLIEDSIARGYADALGSARFRKELGEPVFVDLSTASQQ